ncbi:MAG: tetratricopeptide repeat protein [Verrucomicrobiae bacterium]|nr:tetratricopeptide repeat protein [Verrucomicrobiae bacterium]
MNFDFSKFYSSPAGGKSPFGICAGLLIILNLFVFLHVAEFDFLSYDDTAYISRNPHIRDGLTADGILWAFSAELIFPSPHVDYWQPLTFVSRMIDIQLFGLDPGLHHLMNLLLHLANSILLMTVLARMTGHLERSFWVAALFAIHPLHVESVAWVTERKDVLFTFFWLLGMEAYRRYTLQGGVGRYLLVLLCLACSLMSKTMAATFPAVLLLLDCWPLQRASLQRQDMPRWIRLFLEKAPLFLLSLGAGLATVRCLSSHVQPYSLWITLGNAALSCVTYLVQTIWPSGLSLHYPHPGPSLPVEEAFAASALLAIVTGWTLWRLREKPFLFVGWAWFLGVLTPVLSINDIAGADRFTYVPLIGLFIMIIWWLGEQLAAQSNRCRMTARFLGFFILAVLSCVSRIQTKHWRNDETLTLHAVQTVPDDWISLHQYGFSLINQGHVREGMACLRKSLDLKPGFGYAHFNMGAGYLKLKQYAEAIHSFEKSLCFNPSFYDAHQNIADASFLMGNTAKAQRHYFAAIQTQPGFPPAYHHLALCLAERGKPAFAEKYFQIARQMCRDNPCQRKKVLDDMEFVHKKGKISPPLNPTSSPTTTIPVPSRTR